MIIKEYALKGILPRNDLMLSINCIPVDCKDLQACSKCFPNIVEIPTAHFELPQILLDFSGGAIEYIGTTDRQFSFRWSIFNSNYNIMVLLHLLFKSGIINFCAQTVDLAASLM